VPQRAHSACLQEDVRAAGADRRVHERTVSGAADQSAPSAGCVQMTTPPSSLHDATMDAGVAVLGAQATSRTLWPRGHVGTSARRRVDTSAQGHIGEAQTQEEQSHETKVEE